jgi:acyl carrier protein
MQLDIARTKIYAIVHDLLKRRELPPAVGVDQSLRDAGLQSMDLVVVMLAIEDEFGVEIPRSHLTVDNFRTVRSIEQMIGEIVA